jgi:hypothetical protein
VDNHFVEQLAKRLQQNLFCGILRRRASSLLSGYAIGFFDLRGRRMGVRFHETSMHRRVTKSSLKEGALYALNAEKGPQIGGAIPLPSLGAASGLKNLSTRSSTVHAV